MTPYEVVYTAFLTKILEDEWGDWEDPYVRQDLKTILLGAIPYFKFPRVDLQHRDDFKGCFYDDLTNEEIQLLATYMKCEWLNRNILTWENIRPMYDEKDFSQANLIDKFIKLLEREEQKAKRLEATYYRSVKGKPFSYRNLAKQSE